MEILNLLLYLGKRGAIAKPVTITTSKMGSKLGISQQSISRWLITLEKDGMISREKGIRSYFVQITPVGKKYMQEKRNELNEIFERSGKIVMRGKVVSGMLDGKYYMSLKKYSEKIKSRLGFKPYPGTLNIRLDTIDDSQCKKKLCAMKGTEIPGFRRGGRTFGSVRCFPCRISGVKGAVLIPERSHYGLEVLEIISPFNLRQRLKLSNGDDVKVKVIVG